MQSTSAKTLIDTQGGLRFAKSPRWVRNKLLFLDVHDRRIKSVNLDGAVRTVRALPYLPGGFGVRADGRLIVGDARRRRISLLDAAGQKQIADLSSIARHFLSDSIVVSGGGMYIADVGFDFLDPLVDPVPNGIIVHISAGGESSVVAADLYFPSGMIVTPDNKTLIVTEMLGHRLTAFEIENDGSLHHRRVWAQFQDDIKPDGICLDHDGAIWVAGAGLFALHVREGGEVNKRIKTKRLVFDVMLGGPDRKHLFLCTSDSNDPVITRRSPSATIDVAEVDTPGVEFASGKASTNSGTTSSIGSEASNAA